ncbi:MAG: sensor histidine kinase [Desulfovibrio sp.]|uniref:sensor histidine kinase n=1 Tax=Desulfovibrio sp. 7SRBS1 TaxID=3378064 RepID=UPI003B41A760
MLKRLWENGESGAGLYKMVAGAVLPVFLLLAIPLLVALFVQFDYIQDMERVSDERLTLYESTLKLELNKYSYLPFLIAHNGLVRKFLTEGGDSGAVNRFLEEANHKAGSRAVYILNPQGVVLCASNWRQDKNFIGLDLYFRPYFKDGMKGREGKFYGVGITVGKPGYYMSYPVVVEDEIVGVAVTKIDLSQLQTIWQEGGENLFVADANGVIILSSRPSWKYRTLTPLSAETLQTIHERGQYPEPKLHWLEARPSSIGLMDMVTIDREHFLQTSRHIAGTDWEMSYLMGVRVLWERTLGSVLTSFVLVGLAILMRMFLKEREQKQESRRQAKEARKIRAINTKLAQEIEERKRTERELRAAQDELIEAGKLAAVGEMATAVGHELNQPLAALKMYVASCRLMLSRNKLDELDPTLVKVSGIGDRMARVTGQLKSFARKSMDQDSEFDLRLAIDDAMTLMLHQFEVENCLVRLTLPGGRIPVRGDCGRFEQVLINLFRNALDAMQDEEDKRLEISANQQGNFALLYVQDTGEGIDPEVSDRLFEPFVTTKTKGVGLGLGLSISYKIIKDMGGSIRAENRKRGGARFLLWLPLHISREQMEGEDANG